jgi:hypothetical protein
MVLILETGGVTERLRVREIDDSDAQQQSGAQLVLTGRMDCPDCDVTFGPPGQTARFPWRIWLSPRWTTSYARPAGSSSSRHRGQAGLSARRLGSCRQEKGSSPR